MFSRFVTLLPVVALAAVTAAAPEALEARNGACNTGTEYCCNQTFATPVTFTGILGGLLTALLGGVADSGFTCDLFIVGAGGTCTTQTACCSNNQVNGVINIVCSPISVTA